MPRCNIFAKIIRGMSGTAAVLESPIESYKKFVSSTGSLRTGYTHRFGGFEPGVDRSAAEAFRLKCRTQEHTGQTSGFAPGFIQVDGTHARCKVDML